MDTSKRTVAETIRYYTRLHLEEGGLLYGQCITAVGWVGGTVPELREEDGIVELPTSDCSNSAIVCGGALAGKKPIYIIRYQGFAHYNAVSIVNYAAKSKEMWGVPCPIFVRGIGMEGSIGPVASNMHHSLFMRRPGIRVVAPMTPIEWGNVWMDFVLGDDPVYCSEHRSSFKSSKELGNIFTANSKITLFVIGPSRLLNFSMLELDHVNVVHIHKLKPLEIKLTSWEKSFIRNSKFGVVIDDDYITCGAAKSIAYDLMHEFKMPIYALGLDDKTAGFAPHCDNISPTIEKINDFISNCH